MHAIDSKSTIAAIATPLGKGGIGIIKISGALSIPIATKIFRPHGNNSASTAAKPDEIVEPCEDWWQSHHLHYGLVTDPKSGEIIDEVLLSIMAAPHSYTREDVVEINAHSGIFVLKQIYMLAIEAGAVPAEPGEFTKRAFLNGRIDLVQAEAVIELINARSDHAAGLASNQIQTGSNHGDIHSIRHNLLQMLAYLEAAIDFPEDIDDEIKINQEVPRIGRDAVCLLDTMISSFDRHRLYRDGVKVAIVGRPNVGKSSILNRLVDSERVIVTDIPGTTRDIIDVDLYIHGLPVIITDTAGLRNSQDKIELLGMKKTRERIQNADIVIFVLALDQGMTDEDERIYDEIKNRNCIILLNKDDLVHDNESPGKIVSFHDHPQIRVSALKDSSFERVRYLIYDQIVGEDTIDVGSGFVPNLRQKLVLKQCRGSLTEAIKLVEDAAPDEISAFEIRGALGALDELSGGEIGEDLLDHIFSNFCIGK